MSQSDRAIKKLATQLARLDREVKSWRGAQADFTSIEAGTMDINDSDGNLVSRVGFQDDGSGAVRFFDGPVPPVPSGVTATSDGPIIQATWDGTFEGGAEATYDLAYLEVAATQLDDDTNVSFATITAKEGASASVVADATGDWVVAVRSVSQAGKNSEFATAGTVEVKVTDLSGAIEDVQQSANGKNNVTYSESPPTEADEGIVGDTWFVGATDSESGNWNVVAQYQYTVEGWTPVELSHEVIATVDLGKATVGELDGARITANTIGAETLTADAIDGMVITGATIRSAASGARVQLSANGIESFNSANERVFFAEANTGNVSMVGSLYTDVSGNERVTLSNALWNSIAVRDENGNVVKNVGGSGVRIGQSVSSSVDIYHARGTTTDGILHDGAAMKGPYGRSTLFLGSGSTTSGGAVNTGWGRLEATDSGGTQAGAFLATTIGRKAQMLGYDTSGNRTSVVSALGESGRAAVVGTDGRFSSMVYNGTGDWWYSSYVKGGTDWGYVGSSGAMGVDEFGIQSAAGKNLILRTTDSVNSVKLIGAGSADLNLVKASTGPRVRSSNILSVNYSGGSPMRIDSNGTLCRDGSSARYKDDIRTARAMPSILDVEPRTWRDKLDLEAAAARSEYLAEIGEGPVPPELAADEEPPRYFGAVAEEVDDLGLTELVRYDAFGRPDALDYEKFGVALIPEIRKLRDRITELERLTHE